jgi:Flp pilus assembly protein TadD
MTGSPASVEARRAATEAMRQGRVAEAEQLLARAVAASPQDFDLLFLYGTALAQSGKLGQAIQALDSARRLSPDHQGALNNLATALRQTGQLDAALTHLRHALRVAPRSPASLVNAGQVLQAKGDAASAMECAQLALKLDANCAEAFHLAGGLLLDRGEAEKAARCFSRAAALAPNRPIFHVGHGLALLSAGDLATGSAAYEWRWHGLKHLPYVEAPYWDGGDLGHQATLLLWAEDGMAEAIQFARFMPTLHAYAGRVVLVVPRPLVSLLASAPGIDQIVAAGDPLPRCDAHLPLASLVHRLGLTAEAIPAETPYLEADAERAALLAPYLEGAGFKIGIAWSGDNGSPDLAALAPLFAIPGLRFFALDRDAAALAAHGLKHSVADLSFCLDNLADAAALIGQLDLVIAADNAVAHLAGALGIAAWVMLPTKAHWRWQSGRSDTPWYPSLLLFRRKTPDWRATIGEIAEALAIFGANGAPLSEKNSPTMPPDPARVAALAPYFAGPGMNIGIALGGGIAAGLGGGNTPSLADLAPLLSIPGLRFYALDEAAAAQIEHGPFAGWIADVAFAEADPADAVALVSRLDLMVGAATPLAELAAALGVSSWLLLDGDARGPAADTNTYIFRRRAGEAWPDIVAQIVLALEAAALPSRQPATV